MKPVFTCFAALILFANTSFAQMLQTERKTVVFNHTADWCRTCGDWGWIIADELIEYQQNPDFNAYLISLHDVSDQDFLNAAVCTARVFNTVPGIINQYPSFVVDNRDVESFNDLDFMADTDALMSAPAIDSLSEHVAV